MRNPARQLKNAGIVIFAIGIGSGVNHRGLHEMASVPTGKHVVQLQDFADLSSNSLAERLSTQTCNGRSGYF